MTDKAILVNGVLTPTNDLAEWARWMEDHNEECQVASTYVGDVRVSTVFLALNHGFTHHNPLWYETMVFGGKLDGEQERYTTREQAEKGHGRMVSKVTEAQTE